MQTNVRFKKKQRQSDCNLRLTKCQNFRETFELQPDGPDGMFQQFHGIYFTSFREKKQTKKTWNIFGKDRLKKDKPHTQKAVDKPSVTFK